MVNARKQARDEFDEQARAARWLGAQEWDTAVNGSESAAGPVLVLSAFVGYARRAKELLGQTGERASWDAVKFMLEQPFGAGFWRPQFMKWAALYSDGEMMEAEKFFWQSVFDADQASRSGLFHYLVTSDVEDLVSGESRWLDEWGMVRAGS